MLDFRYLKAFMLTAKYASFSRAAEELNIAQSAVSRQIKLLEDTLAEELIIRSSKKVMLSEKGKELYYAASNFEKTSLEIFQKEDQLPLSIGILEGLLKNWFTPIITEYLKSQNRDITIHVADLPVLRAGIEDGAFDVIFGTENIQSELVTSLKLFEEKLVLISKEEVNKKKLSDHRWIVFSNNDYLYKVSKTNDKWAKVSVEGVKGFLAMEYVDIEIKFDHAISIEEEQQAEEEAAAAEQAGEDNSSNSSDSGSSSASNGNSSQSSSGSGSSGSSASYDDDDYSGGVSGYDIVAYAKQFLGNPYVHGGNSLTNGTDCSGFTKLIYGHFGYGLSRTSGGQRGNGKRVSMSELKVGDIICYSGHVALYIGNGKIIHASTPRSGIIISSMYYGSRPLCARRIIY